MSRLWIPLPGLSMFLKMFCLNLVTLTLTPPNLFKTWIKFMDTFAWVVHVFKKVYQTSLHSRWRARGALHKFFCRNRQFGKSLINQISKNYHFGFLTIYQSDNFFKWIFVWNKISNTNENSRNTRLPLCPRHRNDHVGLAHSCVLKFKMLKPSATFNLLC